MIVEDDASVSDGLKDILSGYQYRVSCAQSAREAMDILCHETVHLIVLDVTLGADNGFDLCRQIRQERNTPILFLTACSSEMELVRGFQMGGDDYVTKPFRMQELIVRIQALLRRAGAGFCEQQRSGGLLYDRAQRRVWRGSAALDLSATEWKLVAALMEHWPETLTREELLYQVWDREASFVEANTLSVNISRLREKLGAHEGTAYIETVRGVGYRWAVPVSR